MSDRIQPRPLGPPEPEQFRRRQFRSPHRQERLILRFARPFLAALAIVGLPSVLAGWVLFSNQFSIREVLVLGTDRVPAAWAGERLASFEGRRIFSVRLAEVETALAGHDWVRGARLRRLPPNRLEVEILERRPVALTTREETLAYLDRDGRVIGPYDPAIETGELVVMSAPEGRLELLGSGLALLESWRRQRLPFADGLSEIEVLTPTDSRVITAALPFPIFVSSLNLAEGLTSLVRYRSQIERRLAGSAPIGGVDLRYRGRIVFQPAASKPHNLEGERDA